MLTIKRQPIRATQTPFNQLASVQFRKILAVLHMACASRPTDPSHAGLPLTRPRNRLNILRQLFAMKAEKGAPRRLETVAQHISDELDKASCWVALE